MEEGIFPHKCEDDDCDIKVQFDDEPFCFTHSPDEGSSVLGYSARARSHPDFNPLKDYKHCGPDGDYCTRNSDGTTFYCSNHYAIANG